MGPRLAFIAMNKNYRRKQPSGSHLTAVGQSYVVCEGRDFKIIMFKDSNIERD